MRIKNYSYKPTPVFLGVGENVEMEDKPFTFGFELEVQSVDGYDGDYDDVCDFVETNFSVWLDNWQNSNSDIIPQSVNLRDEEVFYLKSDSSIGCGFEIVTHPMTWEWFVEHQKLFKDMFAYLRENGFQSHKGGDCGLHFHIGNLGLEKNLVGTSRADKDQLEISVCNMERLIRFYKDNLVAFSRRNAYGLERWCRIDNFEPNETKVLANVKLHLKRDSAERYVALNLRNQNTVEFRLLRGTLNWDTFYLSFNLINNLAYFSHKSDIPVSWNDLLTANLNEEWKKCAYRYMEEQKEFVQRRFETPFQYKENEVLFMQGSKIVKAHVMEDKLNAILGGV